MTHVNRFGLVAVLAVGTLVAPAFAGDVTVGRFYTELARTKHLVPVDAASAEATLRTAGFALPKLALDKNLTEGDVTLISNALGVAVHTGRPAQPIGESQINTYFAVFGAQLAAHQGSIKGTFSTFGNEQGDDDDQGEDEQGGHCGGHHGHNQHPRSRCEP